MPVRVRAMSRKDADAVADLCGQLGYPATSDEILARIARVHDRGGSALFVAEVDAEVTGWIHVGIIPMLECDVRAEILGLVVGETHRSQGVGAELLKAAEQWARDNRCVAVAVRSRVTRERAHQFYERNGYVRVKTQHAFQKPLP